MKEFEWYCAAHRWSRLSMLGQCPTCLENKRIANEQKQAKEARANEAREATSRHGDVG